MYKHTGGFPYIEEICVVQFYINGRLLMVLGLLQITWHNMVPPYHIIAS